MEKLAFAIFVVFFSSSAWADTIQISPGQCINVGSQRVCADNCVGGSSSGSLDKKVDVSYACHYDRFQGSGFPDLKTYALVKINDRKHSTTEIVLKHYGLNGQEQCEKDADSYMKKQNKETP